MSTVAGRHAGEGGAARRSRRAAALSSISGTKLAEENSITANKMISLHSTIWNSPCMLACVVVITSQALASFTAHAFLPGTSCRRCFTSNTFCSNNVAVAVASFPPVARPTRVLQKARDRDEFDEEEGYEYERARRRRGRQRRTIVKDDEDTDDDEQPQKKRAGVYDYDEEDEEDFEYSFDEDFDVDEFLQSESGKRVERRPMALDMADPGRAVDRWPELLKDKAALRDIAIVFGLVAFMDWVNSIPVPIDEMDINFY